MQQASAVSGAGGDHTPAALWAQGAKFSGDSVTCFMTRRCYLPFDEDPTYRAIAHSESDRSNFTKIMVNTGTHTVMGYTTPWHYVDYNNMALFFSPQEFQYLLENYEEIAPKSLTTVLSDLVVKDVSIQDQKTQVTDSGTGGVAIFADESYTYPYVLGNGQRTLPSDIPIQVYELPKYAYLTCGKRTDVGMKGGSLPTHDSDFFFLEHAMFKIYKTGDFFVSPYSFPSLRPRSLMGASQHFFMMQNPLYDYGMDVLTEIGTHGQWSSLDKWEYHGRPQNFFPGPKIPSHVAAEGDRGGKAELQKVATGTSVGDDWYSRYTFRPMPSCQAYSHADPKDPDSDIPVVSIDAVAAGQQSEKPKPPHAKESKFPYKQGRLPNDIEMAKQLQGVNDKMYLVQTLAGQNTTPAQIIPLMPGSVWNERALHYESQIWTKIPNLDKGFMTDHPALGGWGMSTPPPQIFIKMIPTPAPSVEGGGTTSTLHQYAIFNMTVKLEFTLKKRGLAGRWNPQPPVNPPSAVGHLPYVLYDNGQLTGVSSDVQSQNGYERSDELWTAKSRVRHL
ncbi:VP2 [Chipmunk parvovirus]|nr:VP2 [Chipmunk parvovirus]ACT09663.1 VP2 [Chipmunk parvovirus]